MNAENKMLDGAIEQITVGLRMLYALKGYMDCEQQKNAPNKGAFSYSGELDATLTKEQQSQNIINSMIINQGVDMKNITLRKDGRYMARVQLNKNRVTAYGHTIKQVQEKLQKLKKRALVYEKQKTKYTLTEWSSIWLKTYKEPFIKYQNYIAIEKLFVEINKNLGNFTLKQLRTMQIQEFYNTYKKSSKKQKIILYLNACLEKAKDNNLIELNPCKLIVRDRKIKYNEQPFTIDEQKQILHAIKNTDIECYIYLYLLTGIRLNEVDSNIEHCIVNNQFKAINEKQHSDKTEYKYIDISPTFKQYLLDNKNNFIYKPNTVYHKFKKILNQLNIDGHIHKLRHTFATNYYYLGVPLKIIQEWCGHKTPNITQDVYVGVSRENIKNELHKLYNNLLFEF